MSDSSSDTGDTNCDFVRFSISDKGIVQVPGWNPPRPIAPRRLCLLPMDVGFLDKIYIKGRKEYKQTILPWFCGAALLKTQTLTDLVDGKLTLKDIQAFELTGRMLPSPALSKTKLRAYGGKDSAATKSGTK